MNHSFIVASIFFCILSFSSIQSFEQLEKVISFAQKNLDAYGYVIQEAKNNDAYNNFNALLESNTISNHFSSDNYTCYLKKQRTRINCANWALFEAIKNNELAKVENILKIADKFLIPLSIKEAHKFICIHTDKPVPLEPYEPKLKESQNFTTPLNTNEQGWVALTLGLCNKAISYGKKWAPFTYIVNRPENMNALTAFITAAKECKKKDDYKHTEYINSSKRITDRITAANLSLEAAISSLDTTRIQEILKAAPDFLTQPMVDHGIKLLKIQGIQTAEICKIYEEQEKIDNGKKGDEKVIENSDNSNAEDSKSSSEEEIEDCEEGDEKETKD